MKLGLEKKIPISLRNDFWIAIMKAIEDEIISMKEEIDKKKVLYTPSMVDMHRLKELGDLIYELDYNYLTVLEQSIQILYGFTPDEVFNFLKSELLKVPFQVQNKALLPVYKSFFSFIKYSFNYRISVYQTTQQYDLFSGLTLIKRDLVPSIITNIEKSFETFGFVDDNGTILSDDLYSFGFNNPYSSYYVQNVTNDFIGNVPILPTLDSEENHTLDGLLTTLDLRPIDLKNFTKHISFEIVIDQIIKRNDPDGIVRDYLYPSDAAIYIEAQIRLYKKLVEVPHIGAQLTFFIDNTGYTNFLISKLSDLNAEAVLNPNVLAEGIFDPAQISFIKFGLGSLPLPEYTEEAPIVHPTDLALPIYTKIPLNEERYSSSEFMGTIGEYIGQAVGGFIIFDVATYSPVFGIGITSFTNLLLLDEMITPIKPNTLKMAIIEFDASNQINLESIIRITDDGKGHLISDDCTGVINYSTGRFNLNTAFEKSKTEEFSFEGTSLIQYAIEDIIPNSYNLALNVVIGTETVVENGETITKKITKTYFMKDDGIGNLVPVFEAEDLSLLISSSTITYTGDSKISIEFISSVELLDCIATFKYQYETVLTPNHRLYLHEVYTDNLVQIREAGLFVRTAANPTVDQLLTYLTFPAIEFASNRFHLNLGIIFER